MRRSVGVLVFAVACSARLDGSGQLESPVVYGDDDRLDYYDVTDDTLRAIVRDSAVVLMNATVVDVSDPDDVQLDSPTLGEFENLCSTERFINQPTAGSCSGTLIDDDLVLTAGHCVRDEAKCAELALLFGYYMTSATTLHTITAADVYSCKRLVVRYRVADRDYAIVQLDRAATPQHQPVAVRDPPTLLANGDSVTVIGFGDGIPAKVDSGGVVIEPETDNGGAFLSTTDTFSGHSGAGIFDENGLLVGNVVRGADDYVEVGGCNKVHRLPANGDHGTAELASYANNAIAQLCASGWPSTRLCDHGATCGDGFCEASELGTCDDCSPTICGNSFCDSNETNANCPVDCAPSAWTCSENFYGDKGGCDCGCGALDSDCADSSQDLLNCKAGEICTEQGRCQRPGTGPAAGWDCAARYWSDHEGCDCDCGARDPDCDDPSQEVLHCAAGQGCSATGTCFDPPVDAGTTDPVDAGEEPTVDAGQDSPADAGSAPTTDEPKQGGCGCGAGSAGSLALLAIARRRRNAACAGAIRLD